MGSAGRAIMWLALAAALGGALYWAFRPNPVAVEVGLVTRGLAVATVEEDGKTRIRNRYLVSSPLAGRVQRLDLKAGDPIKAGARVATLLPSLPPLLQASTRRELEERVGAAEASVQEAAARLERAAAQESQAGRELERIRVLRDRGAATEQRLEQEQLASRVAERDRAAAELRRHAAEHEVEQARALLRRYDQPDNTENWDITAPVDGRVLRVLQESEAQVAAGAPLLEIGDPSDLEVIVDVLTTDAVDIRPGARAVIEQWGGPTLLEGRVRLVEPAAFTKISALGVEEQRVWVVIDILSPREQWAGLGDGYRVTARITTAEIPDATLVPASALFRRGETWAAFVVKGGIARETSVASPRRAGRFAAVSDGLVAGDRVVLFPPSELSDGNAVVVR